MSITEPKSGTVTIDWYHGHVYYAPETRTLADFMVRVRNVTTVAQLQATLAALPPSAG